MDLAQFPFALAAQWLRQGTVVPFLGAGASIAGAPGPNRLPSGAGLTEELRDLIGAGYVGTSGDNLAKVAQFYETFIDRLELYRYLHDRFDIQQRGAEPASVPRMLATLPSRDDAPLYIVTTNFDTQVETAFRAAGRPLCVITQYVSDPQHGASQILVERPNQAPVQRQAQDFLIEQLGLPPGTAFLYKMHGSADRVPDVEERDSLVITEDDYIDFLIHAGGASAVAPPPQLTAAFKRRRFLFLGYSLEDWNLRAFLRMLTYRHAVSSRPGLRHWAVQLKPEPIEEKLWSQRNVTLVAGDLVDFTKRLLEELDGVRS